MDYYGKNPLNFGVVYTQNGRPFFGLISWNYDH